MIIASVEHVLLSSLASEDCKTICLAFHFYSNMVQSGISYSEKILKEADLPQVFHWAAINLPNLYP